MRIALQNAGLEMSDERDVIVADVEDRPGTMAHRESRMLACWQNGGAR